MNLREASMFIHIFLYKLYIYVNIFITKIVIINNYSYNK